MARVFGVRQTPAWVAVVLCAAVARADVLLTTDGRAMAGAVRVDGRGLRAGDGPAVALGDVLSVAFDRRARASGGGSCVLVDGTTLAGRIEAFDDRAVRVASDVAGVVSVPADRVARVCFTAVSGERLAKVPAEGRGLLLRDGDFFAGAFRSFDRRSVTMSSELLGEASFDVGGRAAAVVLRPAGRAGDGWVVRTVDGSVLVVSGVSSDGGALRAEVAGVGRVSVPWSAVVEARAGGGRVVSLAEVRPTSGAVTVDGTGVGLRPVLIGAGGVGRSVCVGGGTATYRLGGGYTAFAARVGVPAGVVPMAGVRWAMLVDGREVASSGGPRTSVDDPVAVGAAVSGGGDLSVRVEPAGGLVLLADPVLVRAANR